MAATSASRWCPSRPGPGSHPWHWRRPRRRRESRLPPPKWPPHHRQQPPAWPAAKGHLQQGRHGQRRHGCSHHHWHGRSPQAQSRCVCRGWHKWNVGVRGRGWVFVCVCAVTEGFRGAERLGLRLHSPQVPAAAAAAGSAAAAAAVALRQALVAFYRRVSPAHVGKVEHILLKYRHNEVWHWGWNRSRLGRRGRRGWVAVGCARRWRGHTVRWVFVVAAEAGPELAAQVRRW